MADQIRINGSYKTTTQAVGTTAVLLPASPLKNRVWVQVQSVGTVPIYLGGSDVTTTNGISVGTNAVSTLYPAGNANFYAISAAGGTVTVLEMSESA